MLGIKVQVQKDRLLEEYARLKRVPLAKVIRNASRDFLQAAYRATPMATRRTKTGWLAIAPAKLRGSAAHKVQSNGLVWFGPGMLTAKDKRRLRAAGATVPRIRKGYSKATWIGAMRALGMGRSTPMGMETATNVATLRTGGTGNNVSATIRNWLKFDKRPGAQAEILRAGMANAARRIRDDWVRVLKRRNIE